MIIAIAWIFGALSVTLTWLAIRHSVVVEVIDPPVPFDLYCAKCDEAARLQARVRVLEGQLAAMEQGR
jgi:hypothetical protein